MNSQRRPPPDSTGARAGQVIRLPPRIVAPPLAARPFVFVNVAMSADGKIATANRAVHSFGSPRDLAHLYELRATSDAVMCGAGTLAADTIHLGPGGARYERRRLRAGLARFNLRVVVSGSGSLAPDNPVFSRRFSPVIVITTARAGQRRIAEWSAVADTVLIGGQRAIDFPRVLAWLRTQRGVRRLACEGGGELNAALLAADVVQEVHLTLCPWIFGGRDAPGLAGSAGFRRLAAAHALRLRSFRRVKNEAFCIFTVVPRSPG